MSDIALRGNKLTAGRPGFGLGSAVKAATKLGMKIVKGKKNPVRMDQAQRLKDYHRKTKIKKRKIGRKQRAHEAAVGPNYGPYGKELASRAAHPKSWRRAGKSVGGILKGIKEAGKGIGKRITGSHKIKKGGWQDMDRPKTMYDKRPDWEFKAEREDLRDLDKKITALKNVGKITGGALIGGGVYGKWKNTQRRKKRREEEKKKKGKEKD